MFAIGDLIRKTNISDEVILAQIKEVFELINVKFRTGMNLCVAALRNK